MGSGIDGTQAYLDLANSGIKVYLVEKGISISCVMAQLDKTFPTNDCSAWKHMKRKSCAVLFIP